MDSVQREWENILKAEGLGAELPSLRSCADPCTTEEQADQSGTYEYFDGFLVYAHHMEELGFDEDDWQVVIPRLYGEGKNLKAIMLSSDKGKHKVNTYLTSIRKELHFSPDTPMWAGARYKSA